MGFPSVLERIAKALGLYPKNNDPNNRNIPQGIGYGQQQAGRNMETPIQNLNGPQQVYGQNANTPVGARPQDTWQQYGAASPSSFREQANQERQQTVQQTPYRSEQGAYKPDNIVRMPDRDGRDYQTRENFGRDAYEQESSGRDAGSRDSYGYDAYNRDTNSRDAYNRDAYNRDNYNRDTYTRDSREAYGSGAYGDSYGRDSFTQSKQQAFFAPSTIIFCVRRKDDSSEIINYLLAGLNVILTFEDVDDVQCQRVLDFVGGAAFALEGSVEKISYRNYFVAPKGAAVVRSESQMRNMREASSGYYSTRY